MKIVHAVQYIAQCIAAISAGFAVTAERWPTNSPFDAENKATKAKP